MLWIMLSGSSMSLLGFKYINCRVHRCSRFCLQSGHILTIKGLPSAKWSLTTEELKDLMLHSGSYTVTVFFFLFPCLSLLRIMPPSLSTWFPNINYLYIEVFLFWVVWFFFFTQAVQNILVCLYVHLCIFTG